MSSKGRILKGTPSRDGHTYVHLGNNKSKSLYAVHRIVLETFVGGCPVGMECCHGNGVAGDNRLQNLRWDTHDANNKDRLRHGNYAVGENHHFSKYSDVFVNSIFNGEVSKKEALAYGVSNTHYYRIKKGCAR